MKRKKKLVKCKKNNGEMQKKLVEMQKSFCKSKILNPMNCISRHGPGGARWSARGAPLAIKRRWGSLLFLWKCSRFLPTRPNSIVDRYTEEQRKEPNGQLNIAISGNIVVQNGVLTIAISGNIVVQNGVLTIAILGNTVVQNGVIQQRILGPSDRSSAPIGIQSRTNIRASCPVISNRDSSNN